MSCKANTVLFNYFLGLKKFLLQYPALFLVDGDSVDVNCYKNHVADDSGNGKKDYIQEAKDYFSHKLLQYGAGTEVPIKSLLGHRSQASPQVRHISGQHIKEFSDFLIKHTDTFRVVDEHVVLVNYDAATIIPPSERLHLPQPSIDMENTQNLLNFFAQCIEIKGPILVDQLFHLVTSNYPQEQWFRIFKTPNDLTTFLKLFSDCFHVQSNLVTLLQKPKINESHIQHAQKILYKNTLNMANTPNGSNIFQTNVTSPVIGDFKLNEPVSNMRNCTNNNNNNNIDEYKSGGYDDNSLGGGNRSLGDMPSFNFNPSFHEIKLENLCENNLPIATPQTTQTLTNAKPAVAVATAASQTTIVKPERKQQSQSLRDRIASVVTKTLADNLEKDKQSMNALQPIINGSSSSNSSSAATSPVHSKNYFVGDTWKIKVLQNTRLINNVKESLFVTDAIMKSAPTSTGQVVISFDCEGINLGAKGLLTLIEIGTLRGEAFIFDVQACPEVMQDGGLKTLLESDKVIKIIHDCRNDSINLYSQFNILLRNVFDTQVN